MVRAAGSECSGRRSEKFESYATEMTDQSDGPSQPEKSEQSQSTSGTVTLDGASYVISPTAFRSHYQVMTPDGTLVGLIEAVESASQKFMVRPASGAAMTQSMMMRIAEAGASSGIIK
jgi:hypothetical protein